MSKIKTGDTVRDKQWGGKFTGTVTKVMSSGQVIHVAWHGTVVEDEIHVDQVEVIG